MELGGVWRQREDEMSGPWALFGITALIALTSSQSFFLFCFVLSDDRVPNSEKHKAKEEALGFVCSKGTEGAALEIRERPG